ncbi:MAG: 2-oxoglutarate dehydrogenase E1 component, partial [Bacteroidota bacterium]
MDKFSFLGNTSIDWIEEQYEKYRQDPNWIGSDWAHFFEGFEFARKNYDTETEIPENVQKEFKVLNLIEDYRSRGHLFTDTNPVRDRRKYEPTLAIEHYGLSD